MYMSAAYSHLLYVSALFRGDWRIRKSRPFLTRSRWFEPIQKTKIFPCKRRKSVKIPGLTGVKLNHVDEYFAKGGGVLVADGEYVYWSQIA